MKKIIISLIIIANLGLLSCQLWLSLSRATDGSQLVALRDEVSVLKSQNHQLQVEIYAQSSLSQIQIRSFQNRLSRVGTKFVITQNSLAQAAVIP